MKKSFQIIKKSIHRDSIAYWLDENLDFKDKSSNQITVINKSPSNTFEVGDNIIIDIAAVAGHPQSAVFGEGHISKSFTI